MSQSRVSIYYNLWNIHKATSNTFQIVHQIREHLKKQSGSWALNVPRAIVQIEASIASQTLTTTSSLLILNKTTRTPLSIGHSVVNRTLSCHWTLRCQQSTLLSTRRSFRCQRYPASLKPRTKIFKGRSTLSLSTILLPTTSLSLTIQSYRGRLTCKKT